MLTFIWLFTSIILLVRFLYNQNKEIPNKEIPIKLTSSDYKVIEIYYRNYYLNGINKHYEDFLCGYYENWRGYKGQTWLLYDGEVLDGSDKNFHKLLTTKLIEIKNIDHNYLLIYNFTDF